MKNAVDIDPGALSITLTQDVDARDLYSYLKEQFYENTHWPGPVPIMAISWQEPCSNCDRVGFLVARLGRNDFGESPWSIGPTERIINVRWE